MYETNDASFFNAIANDPKVYPWVKAPGQDWPIDVAPLMSRSIAFHGKYGGIMFVRLDDQVYGPHAFFGPQFNRAEKAFSDSVEALGIMIQKYKAKCFIVKIPFDSKGTRALLEGLGFKQDSFPDNAPPFPGHYFRLDANRFLSFTGIPLADIMPEISN